MRLGLRPGRAPCSVRRLRLGGRRLLRCRRAGDGFLGSARFGLTPEIGKRDREFLVGLLTGRGAGGGRALEAGRRDLALARLIAFVETSELERFRSAAKTSSFSPLRWDGSDDASRSSFLWGRSGDWPTGPAPCTPGRSSRERSAWAWLRLPCGRSVLESSTLCDGFLGSIEPQRRVEVGARASGVRSLRDLIGNELKLALVLAVMAFGTIRLQQGMNVSA